MRPRSLRRWLLAALLPCSALPPSDAGPQAQAPDNRSCRADYVLAARVEPGSRRLTGTARITWTNRTEDTVADAWFHLHLNAYSNNLTTHLWEAGGRLGRAARGPVEDGWGWQAVTAIRVGGEELLGTLAWQRPDDGRDEDHTVFSVALPEPVPPGGTAVFEVAWESLVPRLRRRTGMKGDFVFLSHWFPKLGVYEGGRGWNCHQFHANTEFYADYGTYDVTLDLPDRYAELIDDGDGKRVVPKVGASGMPVGSPVVEGGRLVVRFAAPGLEDRERVDPIATGVGDGRPLVHGFAWTADPRYVIHARTFEMTKWLEGHEDALLKERLRSELVSAAAAFGADPVTFGVRPVEVVVLIHPEHESQWERHWEATCAALFFYGIWFGEYPYSRVTVVDPAWGAGAAGGMEYPTLFTCGTRLWPPRGSYTPESVAVHECGHQFWYGLVGNNEYENAWMDEGFNSFTDSEVLVRAFGLRSSWTSYSGFSVPGVPAAAGPASGGAAGVLTGLRWDLGRLGDESVVLSPLEPSPFVQWWRDQPLLTFAPRDEDPRWSQRSTYLSEPDADPVRTDGWSYLDRSSYRVNSYHRPATVLRSLAAVVGETAFRKGMRHYSGLWRYRHPYPEDFYEAFQQGSGTDVRWYFDDLLEGTGRVDWGVEVSQRRTPEARGFFLSEGTYVEVGPKQGDSGEAGEESEESAESEDSADAQEAAVDAEGGGKGPWIYDVVVRRRGELCLPLSIEVTFSDDTVQTFQWTREMQLAARSTWWRLPIPPGPQKVERVLLDPERRYYLDGNMADNQWYAKVDRIAPARWGERAFTQYVHLLQWFSALGG